MEETVGAVEERMHSNAPTEGLRLGLPSGVGPLMGEFTTCRFAGSQSLFLYSKGPPRARHTLNSAPLPQAGHLPPKVSLTISSQLAHSSASVNRIKLSSVEAIAFITP